MEPARAQSAPSPYRGRVRTGCLTCRARKVKCDEARPFCKNCSKKNRDCVWKSCKTNRATQNPTPLSAEVGAVLEETTYPTPASDRPSSSQVQWVSRSPGEPGPADSATKSWNDALQRRDEIFFVSDVHDVHMSLPSAFISRDINLTTTMDILTAHESPHQTWLPFFLDSVQCPWITPYDAINWQRAKAKIVKLCVTESRIQPALTALCAVYKAQLHGLPVSTALSLFQAAKDVYGMLLSDANLNIDAVIVATFLLCLFEVIQYQSVPILRDPDHKLLAILEAGSLPESVYSTLALRTITWLIMLHTAATRGGGEGIMSNGLYSYLRGIRDSVLDFTTIEVEAPPPHEQILTTLASPLFEFYFRLQQFSGELAHLTHYHRSRSSHQDQEEVIVLMDQIKGRLRKLWDNRPSTLSQMPTDVRNLLAPQIADPIISLMGVCTAAYHAEFVEMDRIMGDPVSRCSDARLSMSCVREIVDGDWNAYSKGSLNPAYLRPIFLCAIECMDAEENQWAVEKLRHIRDPICRSDFFASFGEALLKAELEKGRRVTSKYFCISHFGVSPPYL